MNNGKEFAEAKSEFAEREDYNDRWLACVAQWRHVLRQLSLSDLVACHASSQQGSQRLAMLRTWATLHYGPTGDHELLDMIVQLQERLEAYEVEARTALQQCAIMPNIYASDPSAFLRAVMRSDNYDDLKATIDLDQLRRQREEERMQWEAERPDWHAGEYEDEGT